MAALVKVSNLSKLCRKNPGLLFTAIRNAAHWNKDFMPGPYPKTADERLKAAKKYGLTPEEYKPYPDDGVGFGDYPKLPLVSGEGKDPYYPYDFPELKRNFGEPIHVHQEMIGEDRYDVSARLRYPIMVQFFTFLAVMGGFGLLYVYLERMKMMLPRLAKQYPEEGKKHYAFK